jgi:hypothetical protein
MKIFAIALVLHGTVGFAQEDLVPCPACQAMPADGSAIPWLDSVDHERIDFHVSWGNSVAYYSIDLRAKAIERGDQQPYTPPWDPLRAVWSDPEATATTTICRGAACVTIPRRTTWAITNPSGTLASLHLDEAVFEIWDLQANKQLQHVDNSKQGTECSWPFFVGDDTLAVLHNGCELGLPVEPSALFDARTGAKIADLPLGALRDPPVLVGGNVYAFGEGRAPQIVELDVRTGTLVRKLDLSKTSPGGLALTTVRGDLVAIFGTGVVALVDVQTGAVKKTWALPACGKQHCDY